MPDDDTGVRVVSAPRYRILRGLSYGHGRAEPGEIRDDLPARSVSWLRGRGHITPVESEGDR